MQNIGQENGKETAKCYPKICRTKKCLFFFSIKTGVYFIGGFHLLRLIEYVFLLVHYLQHLQIWFKVFLEVFSGGVFLVMICKDSTLTRQLYFIAFCCYAGVNIIVGIGSNFYDDPQTQDIIHSQCNQVVNQNDSDRSHEEDLNFCKAEIKNLQFIIWVIKFVIIDLMIVAIHFCCVLYANYKNSIISIKASPKKVTRRRYSRYN